MTLPVSATAAVDGAVWLRPRVCRQERGPFAGGRWPVAVVVDVATDGGTGTGTGTDCHCGRVGRGRGCRRGPLTWTRKRMRSWPYDCGGGRLLVALTVAMAAAVAVSL